MDPLRSGKTGRQELNLTEAR